MLLKKNQFYVFNYEGKDELPGISEDGEIIISHPHEIIFFNSREIETSTILRDATQLEKEYWFDSMNIVDESGIDPNYSAVSLCDFEDWKKQKGYN